MEETHLHAIAKLLEHYFCVISDVVDDGRIGPAAELLEARRQVPMVDRDHRRDVVSEQLVDQIVVVANAGLVHVADEPVGQHARPSDREPVDVDAKLMHHFCVATPLKPQIKCSFSVLSFALLIHEFKLISVR